MSSVGLLLLAIFLIITFTLIYLSIFSKFDETTFTKRLQVLTEYIKRTNADQPVPDVIGYVSDIFQNNFVVTWINTVDLSTFDQSLHDDKIETFNFLNQKFQQVLHVNSRVRANEKNENEFIITGDNGDINMQCPQHFKFDYSKLKCIPIAPCDNKSTGRYPMDERMLDVLVLGRNFDKDYSTNANLHHPTLYLRCLANGEHVVEECPDNYTFDAFSGTCKVNEMCENRPDGFILSYFPETLTANQFIQCSGGHHVVSSCQTDEIFDRNLMVCVQTHPCALNGIGHTYITDEISNSQYFKCLNRSEAQLITCINRTRNAEGQYECSGDSECIDLPNGTGRHVYQHVDDNFKYNSGQLICDNFEVLSKVECDQSNVFENKLYLEKFKLNVQFPAEIFDETRCVPATFENVEFLKFTVALENIPNHYNVDMQTSIIGSSQMINDLLSSSDKNTAFVQNLIYARQKNALGLNPFNGDPINCFGEKLYDALDATRMNICDETNVKETLHFGNGNYLNVFNATPSVDSEYKQFCAISDENGQKIVENDHFVTRILTNIYDNDICTHLYSTIDQKYTTLSPKYTTLSPKYTYDVVKEAKYIEGYGSNTRSKKSTILYNDQTILPAFNPFEEADTISPLFNPFNANNEQNVNEDDDDVNEDDDASSLKLDPKKELFYSCYYSIPIFKLTCCDAENEKLINALKLLRDNADFEVDCEPAKNLFYILNSYAYLGNGIGCRSVYENNTIIVKKQKEPSHMYSNLITQSNDKIKYNNWLHVKNGQYMACPDHLFDDVNFKCNIEHDKLYYLENMQEY
ncbi:vp91/p95 [Oxyplax ochracea nucleopolyhedrovirus]|uniref:Vp91/p95 n=1 Tax=Oxyplax ochracea nucleopolyhedrovirus TaxID=2083176 RepID=A0A2L0WU34_9ABAC|nr:vp91/p95 [Oxyplax ochracea nucleopolyhedrovirus]AVA31154.1 vp91/p95 [Oxyplax ochracea nucleopolyhedrovirus]